MSDLSELFASSLPIEVRPSKPRYAFLLLISIAVTAFQLWVLATHRQASNNWIPSLCAIASTLGAAVFLFALCDTRPRLRLDVQGVTARGWKGSPIAWSDIDRVWKHEQHVSTMYSSVEIDYVCMAIKYAERWRRDWGPIKKKLAAYSHSMGYGDLYFATKGMNFEADELVAAIQSHIGGKHLSPPASLVASTVTSDA